MKLLTDIDIMIRIPEKEVLRLQGYKVLEGPKGQVAEVLAAGIEEGYRLIKPKAIYTEVKVIEAGGNLLRLDNGLILNIGDGVRAWKGLQCLGVALCTIDSVLENRVSELFREGEYPRALMLDCVGSVAV